MSWTEKVQTRLAELGFDPGPADGVLGRRTRGAIHACQAWHDAVAGSDVVDDILWPDGIVENDRQIAPDRRVPRPAAPWPHEDGVPAFYGEMGRHLKRLHLPFSMKLSWDLDAEIDGFSVHEKCHDSAARCFEQIAETFTPAERADLGIDIFGGCLSAPRPKRGGSAWSMHSWGVAIDFDPARNPLPRKYLESSRLMQPDAEPFWQIWEAEGWVSLGRSAGFDAMHVQAARI